MSKLPQLCRTVLIAEVYSNNAKKRKTKKNENYTPELRAKTNQ